MPRIVRDDHMGSIVVPRTEERDVDTLRQISLRLERENQRLITKNLQLTAELVRVRGRPRSPSSRLPSSREQPALPIVEIRHELPADQRGCPACGGDAHRAGRACDGDQRLDQPPCACSNPEPPLRAPARCRWSSLSAESIVPCSPWVMPPSDLSGSSQVHPLQ